MTEPVMVGGAPVAAGNKRALILLGVAAAIVVMVLVLPKLLFGGGDEAVDELDDFPVVPAGDLTGDPVEDEAALAPVGETFSAKDPFEPLIDAAAASAPATDDGGTTPVPVDVDPVPVAPLYEPPPYVAPVAAPAPPPSAPAPVATVPAESSSAVPEPAPAPTPASAPTTIPAATAPAGTERLALFEILVNEAGRTVAHIRLNGVRYEVAEGDAFGSGFRAITLSLADGCGEFLYGTTSFRQCEGVERLR